MFLITWQMICRENMENIKLLDLQMTSNLECKL